MSERSTSSPTDLHGCPMSLRRFVSFKGLQLSPDNIRGLESWNSFPCGNTNSEQPHDLRDELIKDFRLCCCVSLNGELFVREKNNLDQKLGWFLLVFSGERRAGFQSISTQHRQSLQAAGFYGDSTYTASSVCPPLRLLAAFECRCSSLFVTFLAQYLQTARCSQCVYIQSSSSSGGQSLVIAQQTPRSYTQSETRVGLRRNRGLLLQEEPDKTPGFTFNLFILQAKRLKDDILNGFEYFFVCHRKAKSESKDAL